MNKFVKNVALYVFIIVIAVAIFNTFVHPQEKFTEMAYSDFVAQIEKKNVSVKYVGFDVPDEFIVGYGCDYAEKYRNLPAVCTLKSKVYTRT